MIGLNWYLGAAAILYLIGLYCLATKRNIIKLIIGVEILINAAHLNFIALSTTTAGLDPLARSFVIISIGVGAGVIALALSLTLLIYRHYGTLDVRKMRRLKW